MAKAQFHKNQRVYVKPVGTWATIEKVVPHWTKGLNEPLRIHYDVGLGREFSAEELQAEERQDAAAKVGGESWRIIRQRNKWQNPEDCAHHPFPGTYPVIITGEKDWGGWRVPGAEYDLDPQRIETQAAIMTNALGLLAVSRRLVEYVSAHHNECPGDVVEIAREGYEVLNRINRTQA